MLQSRYIYCITANSISLMLFNQFLNYWNKTLNDLKCIKITGKSHHCELHFTFIIPAPIDNILVSDRTILYFILYPRTKRHFLHKSLIWYEKNVHESIHVSNRINLNILVWKRFLLLLSLSDIVCICVQCNTYIIVTDMEGNLMIYRLPKGRGPYHDTRAVCLSWYCTLYQ